MVQETRNLFGTLCEKCTQGLQRLVERSVSADFVCMLVIMFLRSQQQVLRPILNSYVCSYLLRYTGIIQIMKKISRFQRKKRGWLVRMVTGLIKVIILTAALCIGSVAAINLYMIVSTSGQILTETEAEDLSDVDYILVLGASVHGREPSPILRNRLDTGIALHKSGVSDKMLMSGDGSGEYYDEVGTMQLYAAEAGVAVEQIYLDSLGLCTYDSVKRAKEVYDAESVVIVTQRYHMYRALYVAKKLGIEAYGVASDTGSDTGGEHQELREIAARCKDFFMVRLDRCNNVLIGYIARRMEEIAGRY